MQNNQNYSLIIIAMEEEFAYFLKGLKETYSITQIGDDKLYFFSRKNENYIACRGKIGKASTAFYIGKLSTLYHIKRIFNLGTSGGFDNRLNVGDVVLADKVMYTDADAVGFGYQMGQVPGFPEYYESDLDYINKSLAKLNVSFSIYQGNVGSSDSFITKKNLQRFAIANRGILCCEMEAGAVAQCAYLLKIPFIIIRSISDIVTCEENEKDSVFNLDGCCANCVEVLFSLI